MKTQEQFEAVGAIVTFLHWAVAKEECDWCHGEFFSHAMFDMYDWRMRFEGRRCQKCIGADAVAVIWMDLCG